MDKKNDIRIKAKLAKKRMSMGGYQKSEEKSNDRKIGFVDPKREQEDKAFYDKVCLIMEEDNQGIVFDPLMRLVDKEVYDKLDNIGKQRYILTLSRKYVDMKKRYCAEHKN